MWAYREPPAGLSDEWARIYRELVDPVTVVAAFAAMADAVLRGNRDLFVAWDKTLQRRNEKAAEALRLLHGRAPRTWEAGHAIGSTITPVRIALSSVILFLANPHPTRDGAEATTLALRQKLADALGNFDGHCLLNELASAVTSESHLRLGQPPDNEEVSPVQVNSVDSLKSAGPPSAGPFDGDSFAWGGRACKSLSKKQYDLLVFFWDNGQMMRSATYGELVERVWGSDEDTTTWSAVKSFVSRLDTRLDEDGISLGIHTQSERNVYVDWTPPE
jgi:hypothetical protein